MRSTGGLILLLLSAAVGCTSGSSPSPCASPLVSTGALRILVLGDSIAEGQPLVGADRWTDRLEEILRVALPDRVVEVRNVARGGSKVDFLESSIAATPDLASYQVAIVIEGVNDVVVTPSDEWARRYERAVATVEAAGVSVIIGTAPPLLVDGQFSDAYDQIATILRSIATSHGRRLLDIEAHWRDLGAAAGAGLYSDVIHQGPAGQAVMADLAAALILKPPNAC